MDNGGALNAKTKMKHVAEMTVNFVAASAQAVPKVGGKYFFENVVIIQDEDLKKEG